MRILISNDDGIGSPFLRSTAAALSELGEVKIVVPSKEQSWIGRAFSRHAELKHEKINDFYGFDCHTISGTPADCVNIAINHLYEPNAKPDLVFSGINIGHNIAFPLILSSGTFAAAVEGAGHLIPSFAASFQLRSEFYEMCRIRHESSPDLDRELGVVCENCAEFVGSVMQRKDEIKKGDVFNINYPSEYDGSPVCMCKTANIKMESFYKKNESGNFVFKYKLGMKQKSANFEPTDIDMLSNSKACCSRINIFEFAK